MRWSALLSAVLLAGCGVLQPTPTPPGPLPLQAPPTLGANGVTGTPISWCWKNGCADGALDASKPLTYPDVGIPLTIQLEQPVSNVVAEVWPRTGDPVRVAVEGTDHNGTPIGGALAVSELPPGAWTVLLVSVQFVGAGDAAYVWELVKPESSP